MPRPFLPWQPEARLRSILDEFELDWTAGRLAEDSDEALIRKMFGAKYARVPRAGLMAPVYHSSRLRDARGRAPFHLRYVTVLSPSRRLRNVRGHDREGGQRAVDQRALRPHLLLAEARRRDPARTYLFPPRGQGKEVRAQGAIWDRRVGALYVRGPAPAPLRALATRERELAWAEGRAAQARRMKEGGAAAHQLYIERRDAGLTMGPDDPGIMAGNIGATQGERVAFWRAVEDAVPEGQVTHARVIAELPCRVPAAGLRRIVEGLSGELDARGVPHFLVVHRAPDGGDKRNVHLHAILLDRSGSRGPAAEGELAVGGWRFPRRKDRDLRGPRWVAWWREALADRANAELARLENDGRSPVRLHPGGYAELGIAKRGGVHLGPEAMALERAGLPTVPGVLNALRERHARDMAELDAGSEVCRRMMSVGRRMVEGLPARAPLHGVVPAATPQLTAAAAAAAAGEAIAGYMRAGLARYEAESELRRVAIPDPARRARRRLAWAEAEERRLAALPAARNAALIPRLRRIAEDARFVRDALGEPTAAIDHAHRLVAARRRDMDAAARRSQEDRRRLHDERYLAAWQETVRLLDELERRRRGRVDEARWQAGLRAAASEAGRWERLVTGARDRLVAALKTPPDGRSRLFSVIHIAAADPAFIRSLYEPNGLERARGIVGPAPGAAEAFREAVQAQRQSLFAGAALFDLRRIDGDPAAHAARVLSAAEERALNAERARLTAARERLERDIAVMAPVLAEARRRGRAVVPASRQRDAPGPSL